MMAITSLAMIGVWDISDRGLCPNIVQCEDSCLVEANPDIAGIGVSFTTLLVQ